MWDVSLDVPKPIVEGRGYKTMVIDRSTNQEFVMMLGERTIFRKTTLSVQIITIQRHQQVPVHAAAATGNALPLLNSDDEDDNGNLGIGDGDDEDDDDDDDDVVMDGNLNDGGAQITAPMQAIVRRRTGKDVDKWINLTIQNMKDFIIRQHTQNPETKVKTSASYLDIGNSRSQKMFFVEQLNRLYPVFVTHWPMPDVPVQVRSPIMQIVDIFVGLLTPGRFGSPIIPASDPNGARVFSSDLIGENNDEAVVLRSLEDRALNIVLQPAIQATQPELSGSSRPRSEREQESIDRIATRKHIMIRLDSDSYYADDDSNDNVEDVNGDQEEDLEEEND
jgi:hypothetical protein